MIYDDILDGILIAEKLGKAVPLSYDFVKTPKKEEKQIRYLISLRPFARDLWGSYRSEKVDVDYSKIETQNCYLLRYFLPYSHLLTEELNRIKVSANINIFGNKKRLNKVDNLVDLLLLI